MSFGFCTNPISVSYLIIMSRTSSIDTLACSNRRIVTQKKSVSFYSVEAVIPSLIYKDFHYNFIRQSIYIVISCKTPFWIHNPLQSSLAKYRLLFSLCAGITISARTTVNYSLYKLLTCSSSISSTNLTSD